MVTQATLARPYARAVFRSATEQKEAGLKKWSEALALLSQIVSEPKIKALLVSPSLSATRKGETLTDVLGEELFAPAKGLLDVLASNKRLPLLPEIYEEFKQLRRQTEQTLSTELTSAFKLSDVQQAEIKDGLEKHFKRKVTITEGDASPNLLGGLVVRAGDMAIDASIRGRFERLTKELRANT